MSVFEAAKDTANLLHDGLDVEALSRKNLSHEWESSITIKIDKTQYESKRNGNDNAKRLEDVILIFTNGTRLSSRTMEKKITLQKKRVVGFYENCIYPIVRSQASEETVAIDELNVQKTIHRVLTLQGDSCRVSYNKIETENGTKYTFACEIEYAPNTDYTRILEHEKHLMSLVNEHGITVSYEKLSLEQTFSCIVPKVQMWNCFNPAGEYLWAYKWNGVKAKFLCIDSNAYVWPDAGQVTTERCTGDVSSIQRICMQVELTDRDIVIVEIVAASFDGNIHTSEPLTNVALLKLLAQRLTGRITVGTRQLRVQTFHNSQLPSSFNKELYDGFIIVQDDLILKWKAPTIDVKCIAPNEYTVADNKMIHLPEVGVVGAIYELSSNLKLLRKRTDRLAPSTARELEVFLESVTLLNYSK
uniref:Lef-4 n=1 Tax=Venturia canescens TaxID=32260 RepID=A0A0U1ZIV8_9HYME|nr:Lef-4 [Venturia canescens]